MRAVAEVAGGADVAACVPNTLGLERRGFSPEQIANIKKAFRFLLQSKLNTSQAVQAIREEVPGPEAQTIVEFIEKSPRGIIK